MGLKKIAIIIPCFNEASGIAQVIRKIPHKKLAKHNLEAVVYVVDNNSTDNTSQVAEEAGAIVIHETQQGKGYALRAGFRALPDTVDYVVMLDGDDTYSSSEIFRMIEPLSSGFCDVVVGSRLGGRIQNAAMTGFNRLGNWLFTNAVRTIYRANVTDVLTGYFAWRKDALDMLHPHLTSKGFAVEMEMVTKMARLGLKLTSVPVSYHSRAGESSLRPLRDGLRILTMLMRNLFWKPDTSGALRKIVFVSDGVYPYFKGGKEKRLHELSKRLVALGYDVHIYTMKWWPGPEKSRIEEGVHLEALCGYYPMYNGERRAIKEGVIFGLACFRLLRVRFDVLDVDHMPFFPILSTWLVCKIRRVRLYGTWHEALSTQDWISYMGKPGYIAAAIERLSIRLPDTITAASEHTVQNLATFHDRRKGVWLVEPGVDIEAINAVQPLPETIDMLYIGRLVRDKNVDKFIDAAKILKEDHPTLKCAIVGEGPDKPALRAKVRANGLRDNVTFHSHLPHSEDVYAIMKAAKIFVLPSVREGFSIVTLEALSCGTPVITTDVHANAARYLVKDGVSGSIVPCSAKAIAKAAAGWIDEAQKPAVTAGEEYDWERVARRQLEVYAS